MHVSLPLRAAAAAATVSLAAALIGCSASADASADNPNTSTEPTDTFPVSIEHQFGETIVEEAPERVVVVGLTEQDILLELGITPVATTEWYGEQPNAVWPWATELLGDAEPEVLSQADGLEYERIAALDPDLIVGTNAGLDADSYEKLSEIAPTVTQKDGSEPYFSDWKEQTRIVSAAVGRSEAGEDLITEVEEAYAEAAEAHPEWAGLTATFSQGAPWEDNLYVYPDGLNTDFLTDLGFTITPGLDDYVPESGGQALISAENTQLLDADVIVFATEEEAGIDDVLAFGTVSDLSAVTEHRAVFTDGELAGAIYFLTPLSQKHALEELIPRLESAVSGDAPRDING